MEFKGTKGEWRVGQTPHEPKGDIGIRYFVIADIINRDSRLRDDRFIYNQFVSRDEVMEIHEESFSNAKLISASPDLLQAAMDFVDKVETGKARSTDSYNKFKAAINKALGE